MVVVAVAVVFSPKKTNKLNFDYDCNDPLNARSDDNEISNNTDIKLECFSGMMNTRRMKYNKTVSFFQYYRRKKHTHNIKKERSRPIQQIHDTAAAAAATTAAAAVKTATTTTTITATDEWL